MTEERSRSGKSQYDDEKDSILKSEDNSESAEKLITTDKAANTTIIGKIATTEGSTSVEICKEDLKTGEYELKNLKFNEKYNLDLADVGDKNSEDDIELRWEDDEMDEDAILNDEDDSNILEDHSEGFSNVKEKSNFDEDVEGNILLETDISEKDHLNDTEEMHDNNIKKRNQSSDIDRLIGGTDKVIGDETHMASNDFTDKDNIIDQCTINEEIDPKKHVEIQLESSLQKNEESDITLKEVEPDPSIKKSSDHEDIDEKGCLDDTSHDETDNTNKIVDQLPSSEELDLDNNDKTHQESPLEKYDEEERRELSSPVEEVELDTGITKLGEDKDFNEKCDSVDIIGNDGLMSSTMNETYQDESMYESKADHGLNQPDMMLEIPTQEIIDYINDADDVSQCDLSGDGGSVKDMKIQGNVMEINDSDDDPEKVVLISDISNENCDKGIDEKDKKINPEDINFDVNSNDNLIETVPDMEAIPMEMAENSSNTACNVDINMEKNVISDDILRNTASEIEKKEIHPETSVLDTKLDTSNAMSIDNLSTVCIEEKSIEGPAIDEETHANIITVKDLTNENEPSNLDEIDKNPVISTNNNSDSNVNKLSTEKLVSTNLETSSHTIDDLKLVKPSTSVESSINEQQQLALDKMVEVAEDADSLGLLAESQRVIEDDEDVDEDDDGDDDEDFDQYDESSNQMTVEHSEDSNAPDMDVKVNEEKELISPKEVNEEFGFAIMDVTGSKDIEIDEGDNEDVDMSTEVNIADDDIETTETALPEPDNELTSIEKDSETGETQIIDRANVQKTVEIVDASDVVEEQVGESGALGTSSTERKSDHTEGDKGKLSPSKAKKLEISQQNNVLSIVDLEESSEEDDVQEINKESATEPAVEEPSSKETVTSVCIPNAIEVIAIGSDSSEMVSKQGELVITGLPKPPPLKPARLNTSELTIKTASSPAESTLVIPEAKSPKEDVGKSKLGLQIFNLDSDEEDIQASTSKETPTEPSVESKPTVIEPETGRLREANKCINHSCSSPAGVAYSRADTTTVAYYDAARKRRPTVCQPCADIVAKRTQNLVDRIKDYTPLLEMDMTKLSQELVEISDSESEGEADDADDAKETIGEAGAKMLEEQLADIINKTWKKYDLDERLTETEDDLQKQLSILEEESKEIDTLLNECQVATDKLRTELYATFEGERHELPGLVIYDTPNNVFTSIEMNTSENNPAADIPNAENRLKRRMTTASEPVSKRPAIPLGYAPLDAPASASATSNITESKNTSDSFKMDDDKDISVVKLSAEAAPSDLPPPGEFSRPPLQVGMLVYAMRNVFSSWSVARIVEYQTKSNCQPFSICRVRFENRKNLFKGVTGRFLAYIDPPDCRLTIGTRVIALFKDSTNDTKRDFFYAGVIAEVPNPVNNYRYLVFFDDGYAQYVSHAGVRAVAECAAHVWDEVPACSRDFVRAYLSAYPERPMVRLHAGQRLHTEWNGRWWSSKVTKVDASLVQVHFEEDNRTEWIYRGSTRLAPLYLELQAAERQRARPLPRSKQHKTNMPYVEYTRSDENKPAETPQTHEEIRRQRAVAKKSTAAINQPVPQPAAANLDSVTSRVVYYTPKNAVKPYKMVSHNCGPKCKRTDVLALKDLRTYNPLAKPLLSGWERQIVRYKGHKEVMYRAPCGRRLRTLAELHRYLSLLNSDMPVDLFDFGPATHCLAEFVLNKCLVGKKDLSHGKENVPVPCVNYYDESLPEFCSYNTERTPTAGVPLNLDPDFLCGCDCTDDCQDKFRCACWQMTLEGARTIGLQGPNVGYVYRRLPEPLPSGIYECNSRCKCKKTCLNRVAQHPLQLKLQVFKTLNRGWGIRALNDVPKGSFLCVYAGNLLTDATANLDGLNEGDEYLAELDYIEVVEQMKEGYEDDVPESDKKLDKEDSNDEEEDPSSSSDEESKKREEQEDGDFQPGYIGLGLLEFNKRLRKRDKAKQNKEGAATEKEKLAEKESEEDCITISDDEEVRKPSNFMAQAGMKSNEFVSKYRSVRSLFGEDEACYIMDAKVQGNIGRYLNHSCTPNVFVQNVFVDTHDPRFPWVAFFALSHIRAGTELTWNYNYDVGSVPGKVLYCYCGAPNCRGRLL